MEGRRIPCFEYTEQTIVAHKDWIRKYDDAIRHVKDLTTERKDWIDDPRNGRIFENDTDLTSLTGLGAKMQDHLNAEGITTLGELQLQLRDTVRAPALIKAIKGLSKKKVATWVSFMQDALLPGNCPPKINYRDAPNPYIARYPIGTPNPRDILPEGQGAQHRGIHRKASS